VHVERTHITSPFNDCIRNLDHRMFDYICVLAARLDPERLT